MLKKRLLPIFIIGATLVLLLAFSGNVGAQDSSLTPLEELGKALFFDKNLSLALDVSCASCHAPEVGWTGPVEAINMGGTVYPGSIPTRFGNRKPPSSAYGGDSPLLHYDEALDSWVGGMFWDGRATGWTLGDPLAEQAQGPFLNPLEQAIPNAKLLCLKVKQSDYAGLYEDIWGALDCVNDVNGAYESFGRSIAAYERSTEVSSFTSKYDYYLMGQANLTGMEAQGLELFEGKADCSKCHPSPLFTDFTYDNLGMPKNPENPFYDMPRKWNPDGEDWVDYGLGSFLMGAGYSEEIYSPELGKHKVPTLRNVDKRPSADFVKAYGHNGYFKSLEEITHYYNTRDVPGAGWDGMPWPEPEVSLNINTEELGNLGLTPQEESALVAFMKTLSDGYVP